MKNIFVFLIALFSICVCRLKAADSTTYYKYDADKIIYHPGDLVSGITRTWVNSGYIIFYSPNKDNKVEVIEFWSNKAANREVKVLKDVVNADESPWFKYHLDDQGWFYLDEIHIYSVKRDIN